MVEGSNPSAPIYQRGDDMPRKSTKRTRKSPTRKRRVAKPKPTKEVSDEVSFAVSSEPKLAKTKDEHKDEHMYMGFTYDTWINIILVVAVILIIGILAGVGVLVQNARTTSSVPQLSAMNCGSGIGITAAREKAKQVLDIIAGGANYNITNVYKDHGVYKITLSIKTPTGTQNGTAFMSLDGKQMYFRYLDVDDFLQRYANASIAGNSTA